MSPIKLRHLLTTGLLVVSINVTGSLAVAKPPTKTTVAKRPPQTNDAAAQKHYAESLAKYEARPDAYGEIYRPQYHFSPHAIWLNDPNGLAYFDGKWRLFYQHYLKQGGVSWGYATSDDLIHWQHQPPAITQDDLGAIFSGCGVVDHHDTSGFFDGKPGYVGIYTYHKNTKQDGNWQSQGIAYSRDGVTFQKYAGNPVIADLRDQPEKRRFRDFRDPKVFWHQPTERWVMAVAGGYLHIYSSPNLRDWTFESVDTSIRTECADLFELPIDGDPTNTKWLFSYGGRSYQLGDFDGKRFTSNSARINVNYGPDFYASQSWDNAPDNRRVFTSWMMTWNYGGDWPGQPGNGLTIPVELSLRTTPDGVRLIQTPSPELESLRGERWSLPENEKNVTGTQPLPKKTHGRELEIVSTWNAIESNARQFGFTLLEGADGTKVTVGYDADRQELYVDRREGMWSRVPDMKQLFRGPLKPTANGKISIRLFLDRSSVEVFGNDGETCITSLLLAQPAADGISLFAKGGDATVEKLDVYPMKSIWPQRQTTAEKSLGIHLWKSLRVAPGKQTYLGAQPWPIKDAKLEWSTDSPELLTLTAMPDARWVSLQGLKPGKATVTAMIAGTDLASSCEVYVVANTLKTETPFDYLDEEWTMTDAGIRYIHPTEQRSIVAEKQAIALSYAADVTLDSPDARGGLFIRSAGRGKRGHFVRLDAKAQAVTLGVWQGENSHSVPADLLPGKVYRLGVEYMTPEHPERMIITLDGKTVLDIPAPESADWTRRMGIVAKGKVTIQNVKVTSFK